MSFGAVLKTAVTGLKAMRFLGDDAAKQAVFTFKHLGEIGKGGNLLHRLGFSAKMGGRAAQEAYKTLTPGARQALQRTTAGVAAGGGAVAVTRD